MEGLMEGNPAVESLAMGLFYWLREDLPTQFNVCPHISGVFVE
jgi:hypothetical protein